MKKNNVMKSGVFYLLLTFIFIFGGSIFLNADNNDSIELKVQLLEQKVQNLELRVKALEEKLNQPISPSIPPQKSAWRKLQKGMSKNQVRSLLGEPVRIDHTILLEYWYYPEKGKVIFNTDNQKVDGWSEPKL